ncbi:MAG: hypothetical protein D6820_03230 [Lentisphaerae bacterium]|nr:MAG: hypothetical protein D6820_03230 [Lentisphaerota bacterium]
MMTMYTTDDEQALYRQWQEMHETKAAALETFNEAKFGMFIHWGLYSMLGGMWWMNSTMPAAGKEWLPPASGSPLPDESREFWDRSRPIY